MRPFDSSVLEMLISSGKSAVAGDIVKNYGTNSQELIARIEQAVDDGELEQAARLAHTLKGSSGMVGALQVSEVSFELQNFARSNQPQLAQDTISVLKRENDAALNYMRSYLD